MYWTQGHSLAETKQSSYGPLRPKLPWSSCFVCKWLFIYSVVSQHWDFFTKGWAPFLHSFAYCRSSSVSHNSRYSPVWIPAAQKCVLLQHFLCKSVFSCPKNKQKSGAKIIPVLRGTGGRTLIRLDGHSCLLLDIWEQKHLVFFYFRIMWRENDSRVNLAFAPFCWSLCHCFYALQHLLTQLELLERSS